MEIPALDDILNGDVASAVFEAIPPNDYNAVIVEATVGFGKKSGEPYIKVKASVFDGEYAERKTWGYSSFSKNALPYPGAIRNLAQAVGIDTSTFPEGTKASDIPALMAEQVQGSLVTVTVINEQAEDASGKLKYLPTGEPQMRDSIRAYAPPSEEFEAAFAKAISEVDEDLPF